MGGGARWCPLSGGDEPERLSAKGGGGKGRGTLETLITYILYFVLRYVDTVLSTENSSRRMHWTASDVRSG